MEDPEVIGDWERERVLGCGGFGVVTLWKNCKNYDRIAIKKYRGENDNLTPKQRERWTQEVEMMKKIKNENIVSFKILPPKLEETLNKHNPSKLPMLSMEFCTQGDLRTVLIKSENCCGLPESEVRYILKDLMNAVSHLHSLKITHRDLKPENIVLQMCERPNKFVYKLIDLGYAKELDTKSICASFVGTLQYLAPELMYSKSYSCSVDYWSMGLVAFEIICGTRPFLPNKSPAQWMFHVHKKTPDVISIHQLDESEASITSFKGIFHESHISSCFKSYMEAWLQLALEYNPRKRGYRNYDPDSPQNELAIFTSLKTFLEIKILTVFSVYTCEFRSYEIDDCTRVATVQGWIERDTKIRINEQVLLSSKCDQVELDGLAAQFFDESYSQPMLYIFKKSEILLMDIKPNFIPELVEKMLHDASANLAFYFQKRSYAHSLYFIFAENNTYNTVLDACSLRIRQILRTCDQTSHKCRMMNINIEKLIAQRDFSKEVLDFDFKQYLKNYSQNATHWVNSFTAILNKIDKLHEGCNHISVRHESAYRRASNLSVGFNKEYSKHNDHNLNKLLDEGIDCYHMVRSRSKDKRSKPESCKNMAKIVYQVLKSRDKILRDTNFRKCLQMIVDIDLELEKMSSPLNLAVEHIEKFKNELISDQLSRQSKIWEFTIKQKSKSKSVESDTPIKPNFMFGNPNKNLEDIGTPISLEKPLHFILGDTSKNNSSLESNCSYHSAHENSLESKNPKKNSLESNKICNNSETRNGVIPTNDVKQLQTLSTNDRRVAKQSKSLSTNDSRDVKQSQTLSKIVVKQSQSLPIKESVNNNNASSLEQPKTITIRMPDFVLGEPISDMINYNLSLRHELQEKTHESFMNYKSILNEELDFSFLHE